MSHFNVAGLKEQLLELHETMNEPDFWNDLKRSTEVSRKVRITENKVEHYEKLCQRADDVDTTMELAEEMQDTDLLAEAGEEIKKLQSDLEELRLESLLRGDYDSNNCYLSLHAGAGGTEAQDWTLMLYRMYTRYCERHGFTVKLIDMLDGDEAGIKSASILVEGENAYGMLKSENGVHRLVRVSPFDANARRQTSFAAVEVIPEITDDSKDVEIRPEDIEMQVYRSSGAGGQHINKTSSAVRLIHKPSGIVVACQEERSQVQNREKCMQMLASKLYQIEQERIESAVTSERRSQVGTGMRNERIRTYNFPQGRVTDHRIGLTLYKIDSIMDGALDELIDALVTADQAEKLQSSGEA